MTDIVLPDTFNIIVAQPKAPDGGALPFFIEEDLGHGLCRIHGQVDAVVRGPDGQIKSMHRTHNIVTDAGDLYYAELGIAATQPTNFTTASTPFPFDGVLKMYKSVSVAPSKGANLSGLTSKADPSVGSTEKAATSGYPKVNDADGDNTGSGADVLTYLFSYTAGDWSDAGTFDDCVITNPTPGATEALLMWADGLAVVKSASDTLKVFVNHTFTGA